MPIIGLTAESFEQSITDNSLVIVDFWAPWCGPCRSFAPVFEAASELHGDAVFAKVNTDDESALASAFEIGSIPTLMIFREQICVFSQPGALPAEALEDLIQKVKALDMDDVRRQIEEHEAQEVDEE
ncbi:MAG: thioredoxin [Deltaproteobacteria bacterium]|nr:thioredoxin [Deltaproteobacteria bacterium]